MEQEKIGKFIKEIRIKNNLTQKDLADRLGVTYQAVSKWENGKNIPDLSLMKEIAKIFNVDINEILDGERKNKKRKKRFFIIIPIIMIGLITIVCFILFLQKNNTFEFKTISTTCKNFDITGSIAYNQDKTSIYISDVNYCGEQNDIVYKKIECKLYQSYENTITEINSYSNHQSETLEVFLKEVKFKIDNYSKICKEVSNSNLYLEITATSQNDEITTYKIPLILEDSCINE